MRKMKLRRFHEKGGDYKIRRIHRMSGNEAESIDELYDAVDNENFKRVAEIIESGVKLDDVRIEVEWIAEWFATYLYSFRNAHLRNPEEEEKYEDAKRVLMLLFLSGAPFEPTYLQYLVEEPVLFEAALHAGITFETNAEGGHRLLFKIKNPDVLQIAIENGINLTTKQNGMTFCHFLANEMIKEPIEPYVIPISIVFLQALSKSNKIGTIPLLELRLYLFGTMIHDRQKDLDTMMKSVGFDLHDAYHEDEPMDANALISARNLTDIFCVLFMEHNAITANIPRVILRTTFFGYQTNHPDKMTDEKIEFWRNKMLTYFPHGEDMVGNDGPLFYLHQHTASQGLTAETIEYQLEKAGKEDQEKIPCFFHIIGNQSSCQEPINRTMISAIVSNEAWDAWDMDGEAARKQKEQEKRNALKMRTGLNEQMPTYTAILRNRKKKQEDNTIAHSWTMCAFCLLPMERTYGCNYMGHAKPSMVVEHREHPWCPARFFVKDLWEKYIQVGRQAAVQQLDRDPVPELDHIETCIECGRPCCNHHHVDLEHPGKVIMLADDPEYKKCPGGGRRELIARILAVREVYRKGGFKTPLEERHAAAWAVSYTHLTLPTNREV